MINESCATRFNLIKKMTPLDKNKVKVTEQNRYYAINKFTNLIK